MLFKNPVRTSKRTPHFTITAINVLTHTYVVRIAYIGVVSYGAVWILKQIPSFRRHILSSSPVFIDLVSSELAIFFDCITSFVFSKNVSTLYSHLSEKPTIKWADYANVALCCDGNGHSRTHVLQRVWNSKCAVQTVWKSLLLHFPSHVSV
jgi:hypothetical protein